MNSDAEKDTNYLENNDIKEFNVNKNDSNIIYSSNNKNNILINDDINKNEEESNKDNKKIRYLKIIQIIIINF